MIKAFFAAIIGAFIAFAWTSFSWKVLPFHGENLNQFSNEAEISAALKAGAETPGIYIIPEDQSLSHEAKRKP
ncbi:MAG: hypothetical protein ACKVJU_15840 [Verrucomicrobiales bacterium]